MFYGAQVWDPVLIVAQILVNQCLFYTSLGLLLWLLVGEARPQRPRRAARLCCCSRLSPPDGPAAGPESGVVQGHTSCT